MQSGFQLDHQTSQEQNKKDNQEVKDSQEHANNDPTLILPVKRPQHLLSTVRKNTLSLSFF